LTGLPLIVAIGSSNEGMVTGGGIAGPVALMAGADAVACPKRVTLLAATARTIIPAKIRRIDQNPLTGSPLLFLENIVQTAGSKDCLPLDPGSAARFGGTHIPLFSYRGQLFHFLIGKANMVT
jgi:hypothetical protein